MCLAPPFYILIYSFASYTDTEAIWDKEFASIAQTPDIQPDPTSILQENEGYVQSPTIRNHQETDDLARTAGLLIDSVRDEQNPKFKNSMFMGLMKQLRDHEVVVEGDNMVENTGASGGSWASEFPADVKGKGRAMDLDMAGPQIEHTSTAQVSVEGQLGRSYSWHTRNALQGNGTQNKPFSSELLYNGSEPLVSKVTPQEEDATDAYLRQENAEFAKYWHAHHTEQAPHATAATVQAAEWDGLQKQWDSFEASATGIMAVDNYQFQEQNPYLAGDRSRTRHHMAHLEGPKTFYEVRFKSHGGIFLLTIRTQSVLELEAAVQRDPQNAAAWYELGVKQQENEREQKAIIALRRAVELDPSHLPTWVALAVSYTNDNNRIGTYDAINQWVQRSDKYKEAVQRYRAEFPENANATPMERFNQLIECLISMARGDMSGEIDADIQIALAVLLNTNEVGDFLGDRCSTLIVFPGLRKGARLFPGSTCGST